MLNIYVILPYLTYNFYHKCDHKMILLKALKLRRLICPFSTVKTTSVASGGNSDQLHTITSLSVFMPLFSLQQVAHPLRLTILRL